jgi:hypothetical protein
MSRKTASKDRYRPPRTYVSKDPEKREKQLANLKTGRRKGSLNKMTIQKNEKAALQKANIIEFATDWLGLELYPAQEAIMRALYGLPIPESLPEINGLSESNSERVEGVFCLGARSGKSFMSSIIALYEATRDKWAQYLRKGENGYLIIIATRLNQAVQIIQRNAAQMIADSKISGLIDGEMTAQEIRLTNGMIILSLPCTSNAGRGLPIFGLIMDELAHFASGDEYLKADINIFNSLRPRLAQFPSAKTLLISTPAGKQGLFWNMFDEGDVEGRLNVQASTAVMNPSIPPEFLERERLRDPDNFSREHEAEFAENVEAYLESQYIEPALIHSDDISSEPQFRYSLSIDFSGLSGNDKTGIAVCHRKGKAVINDAVRSLSSTNQDVIMREIARLAKRYSCDTVFIDRYGSGWTRTACEKLGLRVKLREQLPVIYANLKSLLIAGRLELQNHGDLKMALETVRAYYGRNNRFSIQHERGAHGHGDLADAVATAVHSASVLRDSEREAEPEYILENISIYGASWKRNPKYGKYKENPLNIKVERIKGYI